MSNMNSTNCSYRQTGFSLIEMLITMVIAMVILGGLLLSFTQQNSEYKYQNKRVDAVQDLEFAIGFVANDLRSALVVSGTPAIASTTAGSGADVYTSVLDTNAWDESGWANNGQRDANSYKTNRRYVYDKGNELLRYDRNTIPVVGMEEILPNVTDFRVFQDSPGNQPIITGATVFPGSPVGLQSLLFADSEGNSVMAPGYTVLIEVAVDAGYKQGSFINARGVDVRTFETPARKRVWRYAQAHPLSTPD